MKRNDIFLNSVLIITFLFANLQAETYIYQDLTGDHDYHNPANWSSGIVAGANDNAMVMNSFAVISQNLTDGVYWIGCWSPPAPAYVQVNPCVSVTGWWETALGNYTADAAGHLTLLEGSSWIQEDKTSIGGLAEGSLTIQGGSYSSVAGLHASGAMYVNNQGFVDINDGLLYAVVLVMEDGGSIDLNGSSVMKVSGNRTFTGSNLVDYINSHWITSNNGTCTVNYSFNGTDTVITVSSTLIDSNEPNTPVEYQNDYNDLDYYGGYGSFKFEGSDPAYWLNPNFASITSDLDEVIEGSNSLELNTLNSSLDYRWIFKSLSNDLLLEAGNRYCFTFWYKIIELGNIESYFMFEVKSASGQGSSYKGWIPFKESYSPRWHKINVIIPEGVNDYQINFGVYGLGHIILDDIRITELPSIDISSEGITIPDNNYEPYGIGTHLSTPDSWASRGFTDSEVIQGINLIASAGIQWIRVGASWNFIEPYKNNINQSALDRLDLICEECNQVGIKPYFMLASHPQWVSQNPGSSYYWAYVPADMNQWAEFVDLLANRYKNKITYWEINNEVDWTFWLSSPEEYAQYLQVAYNKLKTVDPNNRVIMAGLAFDGIHVWRLIDGAKEHALQKFYDAGVKDYFDIMAIHPYVIDHENGTVESIDKINNVYEIMKRNGDADKPIWITELGMATFGDSGKLQQQADYLGAIYTELIKHPKVEKIFWYNFRCLDGEGAEQDNFGIINHDFTLRPAYTTYSNLAKTSVRKVNCDYVPLILPSDFDANGQVKSEDLAMFLEQWLSLECNFPGWCGDADLTYDGKVDFVDFSSLLQFWGTKYAP